MRLLSCRTLLRATIERRRSLSTKQLVYHERGDPVKILQLESKQIDDEPKQDETLISWLAAPINPADINQLQGVYAVKPDLPAIGGNEGCGRVEKVGSQVTNLRVGDLVIPARSGLGTWRSHGLHKATDVFALDAQFERNVAAMLQVNPSTAYRLLHDFTRLQPGDLIVQNGANSAVGRCVIQIAKVLRLELINVVRNRPEIDALKNELKDLGASTVYTEEEFAKTLRDTQNARLALNCVGGRSSLNLVRALEHSGVMVTYGGMSKQPVQAPTAAFIFKQLRLEGFWMSRWYDEGHVQERNQMYKQLAAWYKSGDLRPTLVNEISLDDYKTGVGQAMELSNVKQLFVVH